MSQRTTSPEEMTLVGRLLFGGFFAVAGIAILAMTFGAIPTDPASVHAPTWVLATVGGVFLLPGIWVMSVGTPLWPILSKVAGPLVLLGLLAILHWIAFGPGVRQCSGGFTIPFFSAGGPMGDFGCRFAFGSGAVLFDGLFAGAALSAYAKKTLQGKALSVAERIADTLILVPLSPFLVLLAAVELTKVGIARLRGVGKQG